MTLENKYIMDQTQHTNGEQRFKLLPSGELPMKQHLIIQTYTEHIQQESPLHIDAFAMGKCLQSAWTNTSVYFPL